MLIKILRRTIFTKKVTEINKLGRWNTIKDNNFMEKTMDWANHDHCGGDLCQFPGYQNDTSDTNSDTSSNRNGEDNIDTDEKKPAIDYYTPYIIS